MTTNNSNTQSNEKPSDLESSDDFLRTMSLFHLSNNAIILGRIIGTTKDVITLHFPIQLKTFFDDSGDFRGFSTMPYLLPFAELDSNTIMNLNVVQITTFAKPSKELIMQYVEMFNNLNKKQERNEQTYSVDYDLSSMEITGIMH